MSYQTFINEVQQRSGLEHPSATRKAIWATLTVLGERLREVDRRAIAAQLPAELAPALTDSNTTNSDLPVDANLDAFIQHLKRHTTTKLEVDQLRAVCQVLAETLNEQARTHLRIQPLNQLFLDTVH